MVAKLTVKNQLTSQESVTAAERPAQYVGGIAGDGQIILTPVHIERSDAVRAKLAELQLTEFDAAEATAWARERQ